MPVYQVMRLNGSPNIHAVNTRITVGSATAVPGTVIGQSRIFNENFPV
jgi:hypothetical protein